jgi:hypothetical protein
MKNKEKRVLDCNLDGLITFTPLPKGTPQYKSHFFSFLINYKPIYG